MTNEEKRLILEAAADILEEEEAQNESAEMTEEEYKEFILSEAASILNEMHYDSIKGKAVADHEDVMRTVNNYENKKNGNLADKIAAILDQKKQNREINKLNRVGNAEDKSSCKSSCNKRNA